MQYPFRDVTCITTHNTPKEDLKFSYTVRYCNRNKTFESIICQIVYIQRVKAKQLPWPILMKYFIRPYRFLVL
jgi:hypothetical protein